MNIETEGRQKETVERLIFYLSDLKLLDTKIIRDDDSIFDKKIGDSSETGNPSENIHNININNKIKCFVI